MKLSEAIRAGAPKLVHQVTIYTLLAVEGGGYLGCALGAAALGAGFIPPTDKDEHDPFEGTLSDDAMAFLNERFPELMGKARPESGTSLFGEVVYRNDMSKHTFEQIAAWLEGVGQ